MTFVSLLLIPLFATIFTVDNILVVAVHPTAYSSSNIHGSHTSGKSNLFVKTRGRCITRLANMIIDPRIHRTHCRIEIGL